MSTRYLILVFVSFLLTSCGSSPTFTVKGSSSASAALTRFWEPLMNLIGGRNCGGQCVGTPTSWKVTFYKAYLSANTDCSSPTLLQDYGANGQEFNMTDSPTLFSGSPANGTYKCLILQMSDNMKFKADSAAVAQFPTQCIDTSTEHTFDIYRSGEDVTDPWKDLDGNTIPSNGSVITPVADKVYVFSSTDLVSGGGPGMDYVTGKNRNQSLKLNGALVVPGQTTYFWDASNGIKNNGTKCTIEEVAQGFR